MKKPLNTASDHRHYLPSTLFAFLLLFAAVAHPVFSAGEPAVKDDRSLDAMSDDLKFQNGVHFFRMKLYEKALQEFAEYLEIYHNGAHRGEALMKMGDIYFSRMDYLRALKRYQVVHEEMGGTETGIEAYFKTGICYKNMGSENRAMEIFKEISDTYGSSVYSQQAKTQLDMLGIVNEQ